MKVLLTFNVIIIIVASDVSVTEDTIDLCGDSPNYENYIKSTTQDCGCTDTSRCIRKCCQKGFYLRHHEDPDEDEYESVCVKNESNLFNVPVYNEQELIRNLTLNDTFMIGMLDCGNPRWQYFQMNNNNPNETVYIQENGTLYYPYSKYKFYTNSRYCVDELDGLTVYLCFTPSNFNIPVAQLVNSLDKIVSMPFLLLTFVVFAVVPNTSIYKKMLMCYIISLFLAYAFVVSEQLYIKMFKSFVLCQIIGFCIIFFYMSSFLWTTAMYIDTWFAFGRFVSRRRQTENRHFINYCLYAWGLPLALAFCVSMLNRFGNPKLPYHPGIGNGTCFLGGTSFSPLVYFYGPGTVTIGFNVVMFIVISIRLHRIKEYWADTGCAYDYNKRKYYSYLKLLVAMGISWIFEVMSWVLLRETTTVSTIIMYILNFCNATYGLIIFLIFVYRRPAWKSFKKRIVTLISLYCKKSQTFELEKVQEKGRTNVTIQEEVH